MAVVAMMLVAVVVQYDDDSMFWLRTYAGAHSTPYGKLRRSFETTVLDADPEMSVTCTAEHCPHVCRGLTKG